MAGRNLDSKYGVSASPKVVADGDPVPKGGGRAMVGRPYVVGGRTYVPQDGKGYTREGWASWYGTAFHGRLTANGEVFDRESVAAAHPTLPLPSYVRVTNLVNRRSMIVRVNDRGPYEGSRLLDVSERVAEALNFRRAGTARVRIDFVGKASLAGSDDEKLLATLRTDGPASVSPGRTMLADLPSSLYRPSPKAPSIRLASAEPLAVPEPDTEARAPVPAVLPTSTDVEQDEAVSEAAAEPLENPVTPIQGRIAAAPPTVPPIASALVLPPRRSDGRATSRASTATPSSTTILPPSRPVLAGVY